MAYFWWATLLVGVALQVLVVAALMRGGGRRFRFLRVYMIVLLLTTVAEAAAFYNAELFRQASRYYWTIDALRQSLIFLVVLSFIHKALGGASRGAALRRLLWGGAAVFAFASLLVTRDAVLGRWMTNLGRNLGFLAVILTLVLWAPIPKV